jgi:putative ABC transport system permease protein
MANIGSDLRHALRMIRKQPGFSLAVAGALGLGLGMNVTVLGMFDAMLLRPFQFPDHERIVILRETTHGSGKNEGVAPANFLDWRAEVKSLAHVAAWEGWETTLTGREAPERLTGQRVSAAFFELLGVRPAIGRSFDRDAEQPGNHRQVVIGDGLWKRKFGADPGIVGTSILLEGEPHTVVGVAPDRFAFPVGAEFWAPLAFPPERVTDRAGRSLTVGAKLPLGQTLAAARAEMEIISRRLEHQHPEANRDRGVALARLNDAFREPATGAFVGILQAAAAMVLLLACANIAGLLLARGMDRQHEFSLRTALGASRASLVRLLVTETIVLAAAASVFAIVIAGGALELMRTSMPADTARHIEGWNNLRLDWRLVALLPLPAIGLGLLVGLFPALAASRAGLMDNLKASGRGGVGNRRRQRGRRVLVMAEIALALALLITAGLAVVGGMQLANRSGGFDPDRLLVVEMQLPENTYGEPAAVREFASSLRTRLESVSSLENVGIANIVPASGWNPSAPFEVEGRPAPDPARPPETGYRVVSPGYFETMRIPVRGRTFSEFDREGGQPVVIISAAMAQKYFPDADAIGHRLKLERFGPEWRTVVGVAGDVSMFNWWDGAEDFSAAYAPITQAPPGRTLRIAIRTRVEPASAVASVREAVEAIDPLLPVQIRTMKQKIAESGVGLTYMASMLGVCGAIALLLSALGIGSVMAYEVAQRRFEFGVRLALGATARDIAKLLLKQAGAVTAIGLGIGLLLALAAGQAMASALVGVIPLNASMFIVASLTLAVISMVAASIPARRALTVDPAVVLREQ